MTAKNSSDQDHVAALQRRVRLVLLLDASREAGIEPLPTMRLHLIGYLSNVLSPVWDMPSHTGSVLWSMPGEIGSVLKRRGGPFYPDLQQDLDRLVGMGVVNVEDLRYEAVGHGRYRLQGEYRIHPAAATPILSYLLSLPSEAQAAKSVREMVLALSSLSDQQLDDATMQDATYADPTIGIGSVIDFGEWSSTNYSAAAANEAGELVKAHASVGSGEKIHLYIRHLRRRLSRVR